MVGSPLLLAFSLNSHPNFLGCFFLVLFKSCNAATVKALDIIQSASAHAITRERATTKNRIQLDLVCPRWRRRCRLLFLLFHFFKNWVKIYVAQSLSDIVYMYKSISICLSVNKDWHLLYCIVRRVSQGSFLTSSVSASRIWRNVRRKNCYCYGLQWWVKNNWISSPQRLVSRI